MDPKTCKSQAIPSDPLERVERPAPESDNQPSSSAPYLTVLEYGVYLVREVAVDLHLAAPHGDLGAELGRRFGGLAHITGIGAAEEEEWRMLLDSLGSTI